MIVSLPTLPESSESRNSKYQQLIEKVNSTHYSSVLVIADKDRSSIGHIDQLLSQFKSIDIEKVRVLFTGYDTDILAQKFASNEGELWVKSGAATLAKQHNVKRTFDYWWSCNSMLVFSELFRKLNIPVENIFSKYELMVLCRLAEVEGIELYKFIANLNSWNGTGKYDRSHLSDVRVGSAMSQRPIIDRTIQRGLIDVSNQEDGFKLNLTEKGKILMTGLHPKTYDKDLPFRLENWIVEGDYDAAAKYIRTLFGRQLRYQRNSTVNNALNC